MPPLHDPDVWLFDLDNTLYPARCNLFAQIDVRIGRYIADCLKVDLEEARRMQKQYWRDHGTSMRGMMSLHGVDPKHYLDYVHDIGSGAHDRSDAPNHRSHRRRPRRRRLDAHRRRARTTRPSRATCLARAD